MKTFFSVYGVLLANAATRASAHDIPPAPDCGQPAGDGMPSICDKYTMALLQENTAENQETVLTLIVNTAVIGNYTSNPGSLVPVPGILAAGTEDFAGVDLAPYFNGALASTNRGGDSGVSVNFLDGGGAVPLMAGKPANDDTSNQFRLISHLYPYFASLLGCSLFGNTVDPYPGPTSMYELHKFMALDEKEVGWFIAQVGLSAASFGVTDEDVNTVAMALNGAFGMRCSGPASGPQSLMPELQAICIEPSCPLADAPACGLYDVVVEPVQVGTI